VSSSSQKLRVAFQGQHGAFSEEAAAKFLGPDLMSSADLVPRATFHLLFSTIDEGLADYLLVPVENSLIGPVPVAVELLSASSLISVGEVAIRIQQHLIGCPDAVFEEIEAVESHPAALGQCKRFFAEHPLLKRIESEDTAGSVARIVGVGDRKRAAIAGRRAAEIYGGTIIRKNLEDRAENYTRFLLLSADIQSAEQLIGLRSNISGDKPTLHNNQITKG